MSKAEICTPGNKKSSKYKLHMERVYITRFYCKKKMNVIPGEVRYLNYGFIELTVDKICSSRLNNFCIAPFSYVAHFLIFCILFLLGGIGGGVSGEKNVMLNSVLQSINILLVLLYLKYATLV